MGQPGLIDVLKTLRDLSDKVAGLLDRERPDLADESLESIPSTYSIAKN